MSLGIRGMHLMVVLTSVAHPIATQRRLHWGCGSCAAPGWVNSDKRSGCGVDVVCDIREGLPFESGTFDYIVGIHVLQDMEYFDILPALCELRRILRPEGVLRLGLPDLELALMAYAERDPGYFKVPDSDATSPGGKLVTQIVWYGSVRTPFTYDFAEEWLLRAGFTDIQRCIYSQTKSAYPDIVQFDNRKRESFFVEAFK